MSALAYFGSTLLPRLNEMGETVPEHTVTVRDDYRIEEHLSLSYFSDTG